jgi:hypothetical protein
VSDRALTAVRQLPDNRGVAAAFALRYPHMAEPHRAATPPEGSGPDHDDRDRISRIEQLLLAGLDRYFAGQYEEAIDIWTRVAFLERQHGRARAYIERARGALAERQREAEELVDRGRAAFEAGDQAAARRFLGEAVARGGSGDTATLLLRRLERVAPAGAGRVASGPAGVHIPATGAARRREWASTAVVTGLIVSGVLVVGRMATATIVGWPDAGPAAPQHQDELPSVSLGDVALQRARDLHARGATAAAIAALEGIDDVDASRRTADELRAVWQQQLLATVASSSAPAQGRRP